MPVRYVNQLNQQPTVAQQMGLTPEQARQQALIRNAQMRATANQQPGGGYTRSQAAQDFQGAMLLHPAWMLDWVNNKIKGATGQ